MQGNYFLNTHAFFCSSRTLTIKCCKNTIWCSYSLLTRLMSGKSNRRPSIGTLRKKFTATGKKPLNNKKNPYDSTTIPIRGQPISTTMMPPKNAIEAFTLCFWKKNRNVRSRPMTQASPQMNKIYKNSGIHHKLKPHQ